MLISIKKRKHMFCNEIQSFPAVSSQITEGGISKMHDDNDDDDDDVDDDIDELS